MHSSTHSGSNQHKILAWDLYTMFHLLGRTSTQFLLHRKAKGCSLHSFLHRPEFRHPLPYSTPCLDLHQDPVLNRHMLFFLSYRVDPTGGRALKSPSQESNPGKSRMTKGLKPGEKIGRSANASGRGGSCWWREALANRPLRIVPAV